MWHISRQRCQKCKKVFFMIVVFKYFCILFVIAVEKFFTYYYVAFQQKLDLIGGYDISITNVKLVTDISQPPIKFQEYLKNSKISKTIFLTSMLFWVNCFYNYFSLLNMNIQIFSIFMNYVYSLFIVKIGYRK